jgi:hypothetical protein
VIWIIEVREAREAREVIISERVREGVQKVSEEA